MVGGGRADTPSALSVPLSRVMQNPSAVATASEVAGCSHVETLASWVRFALTWRAKTRIPADRLKPLVSADVQATAPFIGCANFTDTADGCPTAGTTGMLADGSEFTVRATRCNQYRYSLTFTDGPRPTPFFPLGFCWCILEIDSTLGSPVREWRACHTTEIDVADSGVQISSGG